jgi:type III secretory pathway component EscU
MKIILYVFMSNILRSVNVIYIRITAITGFWFKKFATVLDFKVSRDDVADDRLIPN